MWTLFSAFCLSCVLFHSGIAEHANKDTYLHAFQNSHNNYVNEEFSTDGTQYDYQPPTFDAMPQPNYGPLHPQPTYGAPSQNSYGPPMQLGYDHLRPVYGPPIPIIQPSITFNQPRVENWLLDKFKFKLNLFTIGKIFLKLIIFKKIVKFVGLICLLLFLPKLKNLAKDDDDSSSSMELRLLSDKNGIHNRINELTNFAMTAMEASSKKYERCESTGIWCRLERAVDIVDQQYPMDRVAKMYLANVDLIMETP